jgi:hypothetical protein
MSLKKKNIWTTTVDWKGLSKRFDYKSSFLLCGSCFADRVGQKLQRSKFHTIVNPCGIAFDPLSIFRHIDYAMSKQTPEVNELIHHDGLWHNLQYHSSFSSESQIETLRKINAGLELMRQALKNADLIVFTFGSAWYMEQQDNLQPIANAHKIAGDNFRKMLSATDHIVESCVTVMNKIRSQNPKAHFIISVSPVRYLRDGNEGNMRSKARLIEAAHQICEVMPRVNYFPAYEIVMDELRDYRWYANDMLHVSDLTVEYVWEKFREGAISKESLSVMEQIEPLIKFTEHRPIHESKENYAGKCILKELEINEIISRHSSQG